MKIFKRCLCVIISVLLMFCGAVLADAAEKSCSWYCAHVKDHARPAADGTLSYIEKYDGYYIAPNKEDKVIYLTFDAGYENGNVAKILDVLGEKQVPAAFFVLSHLINKNTDLVKRMFAEGHTVGNHTCRHRDMSAADRGTFEQELNGLRTLCKEKTGYELADYYRPPEGRFCEDNLKWAKEMDHATIFWSFAYADWDNARQMSPQAAIDKIMDNIHPGEIMLLHPTSDTNAAILGEVIDRCRAQGYRFGTLDELTGRA